MSVSSSTPGIPSNRCPFCEEVIQLARSQQFGDTPCPACGRGLWFVTVDGTPRVIEPIRGETFEDWLARFLSEHLNVSADEVKQSIRKATAARYN